MNHPRMKRLAWPALIGLVGVTSPAPAPPRPAPLPVVPFAPDTPYAFRFPTGIAVDAKGAVYVSSTVDSSVVVFAPGAAGPVAPVRRIGGSGSDLVSPQGIAIDSHGRLLVSVGSQQTRAKGSITVYATGANGDVAPVRTIVGNQTGLETPSAIAIGKRGRVYVANGSGNLNFGSNMSTFVGAVRAKNAVLAFGAGANGDAAPEQSLPDAPGKGRPVDIAVDHAGNLVTLAPAELTVWGNDGPSTRVFGAETERGPSLLSLFGQALHPTRVAVGPDGALYVAPWAAVVPPDASAPPRSPLAFIIALRSPKSIAIYTDPESSDTTPRRTIGGAQTDLTGMVDMAVGKDGTLYVLAADPRSNEKKRIQVYPPNAEGDVAPIRMITGPRTGLVNSVGIAVDRDGRIYVLNNLGGQDPLVNAASITVYGRDAMGDAEPVRTIAGRATRMFAPTALAAADDGSVYVANAGVWYDDRGSLRVYADDASGAEPPLRTIVGLDTKLIGPTSLAVGLGDTVYVRGGTGIAFGHVRISVFAPNADGEAPPVRTIEGDSTGFSEPSGIAVDEDGQLFVANLKQARGINAYGPDLGAVSVYRGGTTGNQPPARTIGGSYTRLNGPSSVARDKAGNIYVANRWGTGPGSVTVYGWQAQDDARPTRMIAGPATGLKSPAGVALDAHDTLYVLNERTVTVYAPGATGDVAPIRTIGAP